MQTTVCVDPASQLSCHSFGTHPIYQLCDNLLIKNFGIVSRPPVSEYGSKGQVSSPKKNHAAAETARDLWLDACPVFLKMQFELRSGREEIAAKKMLTIQEQDSPCAT